MKKKLLVAAVMAALTLSTASVFAAAPTFSGDANLEYDGRDTGFGDGLTNRIRLVMDNQIDQNVYLHGRFVSKNYINGGEVNSQSNNLSWPAQQAGWEHQIVNNGMEQGYIGYKTDGIDIKAGRQSMWLANGMLADVNGINGVSVTSNFDNTSVYGFAGRDGQQKVYAAQVGTKLGSADFGATYLKNQAAINTAYWGVNASAPVADNAVAFAQYAKSNAATDNSGYWFGVKVGNAAKAGDFDYSLAYVHVDANATPLVVSSNPQEHAEGPWLTDGNMYGGKGLRFKAHYAVSDHSTLTVYQDQFKNINSKADQRRTDVEYEVRF